MHSYTLSNWDGSYKKKQESSTHSVAQMEVIGSITDSSSAPTTGQAIAHDFLLDAGGPLVDDGEGDQAKRLNLDLEEINGSVCVSFAETLSR